jgi:3-deoxy-D-manno-octulosonic-acid transferase
MRTTSDYIKTSNVEENNRLMCCICGSSLNISSSVLLAVSMQSNPEEVQALYAHPKCFDNVLHLTVPRHPDLLDIGSN